MNGAPDPIDSRTSSPLPPDPAGPSWRPSGGPAAGVSLMSVDQGGGEATDLAALPIPEEGLLLGLDAFPAFDRLARLAAALLRAPVSVVSWFSGGRQIVIGQFGLQGPLAAERALRKPSPLCRSIAVTGEPRIIGCVAADLAGVGDASLSPDEVPRYGACQAEAYVGIPLRDEEGRTRGVFCVLDNQPREWQAGEIGLLSELAAVATQELALHRADHEREKLAKRARQTHRLEEIGNLTLGMAHELNNFLTVIFGRATLALQGLERESSARESLEEICRAGRRACELLQRTLRFARPRSAVRQRESLAGILGESVNLLRATLPSGVQMEVRCADPELHILADATQVEQVLVNLTLNAWHALEGRPGRITFEVDAATPGPTTHPEPGLPPGDYVRLVVRDTGKGIEPDVLGRIFEPFFTTKPSSQGSGLGLAIVRDILREHGGEVTVRSEVGRGTEFVLLFPAA